jgi:hypothetical protein
MAAVHKEELTSRELATILFALRYLQENYDSAGMSDSEHFKDGEENDPCTMTEIDDLCERLNTRNLILGREALS